MAHTLLAPPPFTYIHLNVTSMSSELVSPAAPRRSTRSRQESMKSLAALFESNLHPNATAVVFTCRSGNDTEKSKSACDVGSLPT